MNIDLKLGFSKILLIVSILLFAGASLVVLNLNLVVWVKALLFFVILSCFFRTLYSSVLLKSGEKIVRLFKDKENNFWRLTNIKGEACEGRLVGEVFISRWLIILNFKINGKFFSRKVVICSDSVEQEALRQLRIYLLHMQSPM